MARYIYKKEQDSMERLGLKRQLGTKTCEAEKKTWIMTVHINLSKQMTFALHVLHKYVQR